MRFLSRYLVVALFVVGLLVGGGLVVGRSCSAASVKCQSCDRVHDSKMSCKDAAHSRKCQDCDRVHHSKMSCKEAARQSQEGGKAAGGKAATFKAAFVGASAARVGNLTAGLSVIQSQAANMVSRNFTPYNYNSGYRAQ